MTTDTMPNGARTWIAVAVSLVLHAGLIAATRAKRGEAPRTPDAPFAIDVEVAPTPDVAEPLPPEMLAQAPAAAPEAIPQPAPEPPAPPPPEQPAEVAPPLDAGVPPDAAPPRPEPADAGTEVALATPPARDGGGVGDAGGDGGVAVAATTDPVPVSAGTAANLLAFFPDGHRVTVLIRFDRLRDTEWADVAQSVLGVMPDYDTLVAKPSTVVADELDLIAISTPKPRDVDATLVAMKSAITPGEMRSFLDQKGARVEWARTSGGVLGTRQPGARVHDGDTRLFLQPYDRWTVLARKDDLDGMLDPVDGPLDDASADRARMPTWLAHLADIEAESGVPDGPALMVTLRPRSRTWDLGALGLGDAKVKAPQRVTLSLEIDEQGWQVKGNLKFGNEKDAQAFVDAAEAARETALGSTLIAGALEKANALHAVKGLSFRRTDTRVSYATSLSIDDARALSMVGVLAVGEYFRNLQEEVDKGNP